MSNLRLRYFIPLEVKELLEKSGYLEILVKNYIAVDDIANADIILSLEKIEKRKLRSDQATLILSEQAQLKTSKALESSWQLNLGEAKEADFEETLKLISFECILNKTNEAIESTAKYLKQIKINKEDEDLVEEYLNYFPSRNQGRFEVTDLPKGIKRLYIGQLGASFKGNSLVIKAPGGSLVGFLEVGTDCEALLIKVFSSLLLTELELFEKERSDSDEKNSLLNSLISEIEIPISIMSQEGDLLVANKYFTDIGLFSSKCFSLKSDENIEIQDKVFHVKRVDQGFLSFFYFLSGKHEQEQMSGYEGPELGIVSGSIAHELNNPLAGILAALSLLEIEDLDDEGLKEIAEMKESAFRCKKLVELFLGFSKTSPGQVSRGDTDILDQAIQLLKFRMIESNIKLNFRINQISSFNQGTDCVTTMVLYLMLNEYLTAISHYDLIDQGPTDDSTLRAKSIDIKIDENYIELKGAQTAIVYKGLLESKLFAQLISMSELSFKLIEQSYLVVEGESK